MSQIPMNLAAAICKRHKDAVSRVALIDLKPAARNTYTYGGLDFMSDKFATALARYGIKQGDAVAVILPQSAALITAHLGALKLGAVVVPLHIALDQAAVELALIDSDAKAVVADFSVRSKMAESIGNALLVIAGDNREANENNDGAKSFWREINEASSDFTAVEPLPESPAFIFYTSGSSRVAHNHAALIEQLAAFESSYDFAVDDQPVYWTASDGCSVETLFSTVYPALWCGRAVVSK